MNKINSFEELTKAHENFTQLLKLRKFSHEQELGVEHTRTNREILVCGGTGCQSAESALIIDKLKENIKEAGLDQEVKVLVTGCFGFCEKGS